MIRISELEKASQNLYDYGYHQESDLIDEAIKEIKKLRAEIRRTEKKTRVDPLYQHG